MQYMGGKFKIRKSLGAFINKNLDGRDYYEPFVGAAWVLGEVKAQNRHAADYNPWLIIMWKALQKGWVPPDNVSEEEYKWYKDNKPLDDPMTAFCGFGCSFAAKWFGGYARESGIRNYAMNARTTLLKQTPSVDSVHFAHINYKDLLPEGAFVYCDPPYQNTTAYGAVEAFNHDDFWQVMREWSKKNTVIVSEYSAPEDFVCVAEFQSKMGLRNKAQDQEVRSEKVFAHESIAWEIVC